MYDITLGQFGSELRRYGISAKISYGENGYNVIIKDRGGREYIGFSWDVIEAVEFAMRGVKEFEEDTEKDIPRETMITLNEIAKK